MFQERQDECAGFVPYPPAFVERYHKAGYWQDQSIAEVFQELCTRYGERIALISHGEEITYQQVAERVERLALHFLALGLQPGDNFVMQLPNTPAFVYVYLALQYIGVRPVMAPPSHRLTEISSFVDLSQAVAYAMPEQLGDFAFEEMACTLKRTYPHLRLIFVLGQAAHAEHITLSSLLATESGLSPERLREVVIDPTTPALFLLSGGTTGVPKLIPRTHNDYLYNSRAAAGLSDVQPDDKLLVVLPLAHNFPLACPGMQGCLMQGACVVLSTSTRPEDICSLIEQHQITHLQLVPTLLLRLLTAQALVHSDLSSLRIIMTGGQKLQPEIKQRTQAMLPTCIVQEYFGMAEGLLCLVRLEDPDEIRFQTVGSPLSRDDEVRLVDEKGHDVADGSIGELFVRGPYTLRGYFRSPEQNAISFTADGFYKTGDLMRRHPSGNYIVEGRKKDLINRGGEKISAEEIENLLLSHPAIFNVACVPIPDPVLGERMCAYVILREGRTLTLEDVNHFLSEKGIAKFKLPERLAVVKDFPLTSFGKVSKSLLAKQFERQAHQECS